MSIPPIISEQMSANDKALQELIGQYSKQIEKVVPQLIQDIQIYQESDGKLAQVATSASFVKSILGNNAAVLTEGLDAFLEDAGRKALETYGHVPGSAELLSVGKREMATVVTANHKDLSRSFGKLSKALQSSLKDELVALSLSPKSPELSAKNIAQVVNVSVGQARTLLGTAMASTQRDLHKQALDSASPEREMYVLYVGPNDGKTRPFCSHIEGKAIRREDLDRLDNGQKDLSDVSRFGGGYNCRHRLLPVAGDFVRQRNIPIASASDIAKANAATGEKR